MRLSGFSKRASCPFTSRQAARPAAKRNPDPTMFRTLLLSTLLVTASFAADAIAPDKTIALFNGRDLAGWTEYRRPTDSAAPATWSVANSVIKCTGIPAGYIRTEGRYRNYRLTVEWRWLPGEMPLNAQGRPRGRNSGVLVHVQAPDGVWPKSLEAQLAADNAGDYWVIGGVDTAQHATAREKAIAAAGSDEAALKQARGNRRYAKSQPSSERSLGEWNTYEITCAGDTVTVKVNGVEQNRATAVTVQEGHIALQSEGAPIEFRNVKLEPLL